jgi:hypothetical protein
MDKDNHKKLAIEAFNKTWEYIELESRTTEETLEMIHLAHASRYHWGFIGTELNKGRGEWQISRVYSISNLGESALLHAQRYLDICLKNNYMDWDIAFAYEAMAFAYKVLGNEKLKTEFKKKGIHSLEDIKDKGDRDYAESELNKI